MAIRRAPRPDRYYVLNHEIIDAGLSAEALGVLVYVLSRPDNWVIYPSQLADQFNCGKDKMTRILKEIRAAGYAQYSKVRNQKGSFSRVDWVFSESKSPEAENPEVGNQDTAETLADTPEAENPDAGNPETGNPETGNPHLLNKDYITNKDITPKKEGGNPPNPPTKRKRFKPPLMIEVRDYQLARGSPVDPEAFIDFYESKDWMIGKNRMKDWKAAFRTWEKREVKDEKRKRTTQERRSDHFSNITDYAKATDF